MENFKDFAEKEMEGFELFAAEQMAPGHAYTPDPIPQPSYSTPLSPINIMNPAQETSSNAIILAPILRSKDALIKMYSGARGISPDRYSVIDDEIVFLGDDGNIYREKTKGVLPALKRFGIETATDPTIALTTGAGAVARGAAKGLSKIARGAIIAGAETSAGAAGALVKNIGARLYGEERPIGEDVLLETVPPLAIQTILKGGQLGIKALSKLLFTSSEKGQERIIKKTLGDLGVFEPKQIDKILKTEQAAKEFGLSLNLGEKVEDIRALAFTKGIKTQEMQQKLEERSKDLLVRIPETIRRLLPDSPIDTPFRVKEYLEQKLINNSMEVKELLDPLYKVAFGTNPVISTSRALKLIDKLADPKNATAEKQMALRRFKKDMITMIDVSPQKAQELEKRIAFALAEKEKDPNRPPAFVRARGASEPKVFVLHPKSEKEFPWYWEQYTKIKPGTKKGKFITLRKLDELKTKIDKGLYGTDPNNKMSYLKKIDREVKRVEKMLLAEADMISPDYRKARVLATLIYEGEKPFAVAARGKRVPEQWYQEFAEEGVRFRVDKELIEPLTKLSGKDIWDIGSYILSSTKSSPALAQTVKNAILERSDGQKIWNQIAKDYILYEFAKIPVIKGNVRLDIGGEIWKRLFGTPQKAKMMEVALTPEQYQPLYNFMDLLRKSGTVFGPTIVQTTTKEGIKEKFANLLLHTVKPMVGREQVGAKVLQTITTEQGVKKLVETLWDPDIASKLYKWKEDFDISQNKELLINQLLSLMSWISGKEVRESE